MKRLCSILCLLCGLAIPASAAVKVLLSGGVLRDESGVTLPPGSLVAVVASTQDNVFGVPTPSSTLQVGATFGGDDVVLAVFPVGPQNTAVDGGFVGMVDFDYAAMAIPNLGAGDQLKLYWFPAASLNGTQIKPTASYGAYRTDSLKSRSNTTWLAPDDSSGGAVELNLFSQAIGGDIDNSLAIGGLNVASTTPDVTVAATDANAAEPSDPGVITFTRNGSTASALTINFTVTGTATAGSDYPSIGTSVTFAAGSATTTLAVNPIDDQLVEGEETVVLTLANGSGYTVGSPSSATITIQDDDGSSANIAVSATDPLAGEIGTGQGAGTFTFTRSGPTSNALTVNFTVGGTATSGSDYTPLGTTVSFAPGSSTATVSVNVLDDSLTEGDETVVVTLAGGSGYSMGTSSTATVTIQDDDSSTIAASFVTGVQLGPVRNDYTGWVGMQIVVGSTPLAVSQLGRMMAPGNSGTHTVKIVLASDGQDVPGGSVAISMNGGAPGQFKYGNLSNPISLNAGT
ncbi:MAG: Calx-beta domain-containing protein, partial [Opitutaceae bacterium]